MRSSSLGRLPPHGHDGHRYKTTDGGHTFKKLTQGLPTAKLGRVGLDWYAKDPHVVFAILDALRLSEDDVVVDLGCGRGRVVCCAALRRVRGVIGVEYEEELARIARENADRLRGRHSPVTIVHGGAQDFDYAAGTVFYLYNPFGAEILGQVMTRLKQSLARRSHPIRIVYMKPHCELLMLEVA